MFTGIFVVSSSLNLKQAHSAILFAGICLSLQLKAGHKICQTNPSQPLMYFYSIIFYKIIISLCMLLCA